MEQKMEDTARELMESDPTVKGVACSDETGAALFYRGTLNARHAAFASQIAALAGNLEPQHVQPPAVTVSFESSRMIIKKNGPVIVTVHKVTTDEAGTTVGE